MKYDIELWWDLVAKKSEKAIITVKEYADLTGNPEGFAEKFLDIAKGEIFRLPNNKGSVLITERPSVNGIRRFCIKAYFL